MCAVVVRMPEISEFKHRMAWRREATSKRRHGQQNMGGPDRRWLANLPSLPSFVFFPPPPPRVSLRLGVAAPVRNVKQACPSWRTVDFFGRSLWTRPWSFLKRASAKRFVVGGGRCRSGGGPCRRRWRGLLLVNAPPQRSGRIGWPFQLPSIITRPDVIFDANVPCQKWSSTLSALRLVIT